MALNVIISIIIIGLYLNFICLIRNLLTVVVLFFCPGPQPKDRHLIQMSKNVETRRKFLVDAALYICIRQFKETTFISLNTL